MNLKRALAPDRIFLDLAATTRDAAIEEMVTRLAAAAHLADTDGLVAAVKEREAKQPTGLEAGVAVPHAKTDLVDEMAAAVGRLVHPIDFGAHDGLPARILVMTISPKSKSGPHLQFISEVVKLLRDATLRDGVLEAPDAEVVYRLMTS